MPAANRPTVLLPGAFDTKGRENLFVRDLLLGLGVEPVLIDFGILRDPEFEPDIAASAVAKAAGTELAHLRARRDIPGARFEAITAMRAGLIQIVSGLHREGRVDGILGLGGGEGSTVISGAMRELPYGLPKLLVTTMTPSNIGDYFGLRDLSVMWTVTDIAGLNPILEKILINAAHAMAGMVLAPPPPERDRKPLIAISMFGITTTGAMRIQQRLEEAGLATIVFHAIGSGGAAMEQMISEGLIDGVVDFTPSEINDDLYGGIFSAGPTRMLAAAGRGVPQVVVPGSLTLLTFGSQADTPPQFIAPGRTWVAHSPNVTCVRANEDETAAITQVLVDRIAASNGPVEVVLPLGGISDYEMPGGPLHHPGSDDVLYSTLRQGLPSHVRLIEDPHDINAPEFADLVAERFVALFDKRERQSTQNQIA